MRGIMRLLMMLCCAAMICLVWPGLVQRTEAETAEAAAVPQDAILMGTSDAAMPQAEAVIPQRSVQRRADARLEAQQPEIISRPVCDGNGWPLTGRPWAQEVYVANPPEGIPGS